jgi:hypothetical protein
VWENDKTISCKGTTKQRQVYHSTDLICTGNLEGATACGARRLPVCYVLTILQIILTDWAVSRKQIGKHVPKPSRIEAHCYATVRVLWFTTRRVNFTVESWYPRQRSFKAQQRKDTIRLTVGNGVAYSVGWRVMSDTEVWEREGRQSSDTEVRRNHKS